MNTNWAINQDKLKRCLIVYPESEEKCKQMYIALGGLVKETAPEAIIEPITQEQPKVVDMPVSQFQCKECPFIGKNDKSLALHFRKKHNVK